MKRFRFIFALVLMLAAISTPSSAATRLIVRDSLGLTHLKTTCLLLGCSVQWSLGDPNGQVFLITTNLLDPLTLLKRLSLNLGIVSIEIDQVVKVKATTASKIPDALYDHPLGQDPVVVWCDWHR